MSVTAAEGFVASGLAAGIKEGGAHDMALVATADGRPVNAAAVFTQNKFVAPPVVASRSHLEANGGKAAAIIINSGNANAGTGKAGMADAEAMCSATAHAVGCSSQEVLVCSTGLIGIPLPIDTILSAVPHLAETLSVEGGEEAALGILTTDTRKKESVVRGSGFTVGGMAKGCGMIAPNMATMLAFLTTDADVPPAELKAILQDAADRSFNTLSVDGATSTNDTVIILASGKRGTPDMPEFADAVHKVCEDLTFQMARDAEGMTKMAVVRVTGAASDAEARTAAQKIADNNLVKCSWHGSDPYWGRLLGAAGSADVAFDMDASAVFYGGIKVAEAGAPLAHDETSVASHMKNEKIDIEVVIGTGTGKAQMIGIDLGPGYIKENIKTS